MNKKRMIIFIVCYIAYTAIYVARLNLSMASPEMISSGIANTAQIGMLGSVFSVVYAFGRILNGFISDKKQPWIMISLGLFVAGISNLFIGFFPPFAVIAIMWGANAFAQSMLWSSVLRVISAIYDEAKAKKVTSYAVTSVAAGNIIGIALNTYIIHHLGLKYGFIIPGAMLIIICMIAIISLKKVYCKEVKVENNMTIPMLLSDKKITSAIIPAILHGIIKDNISIWMTIYFVSRFSIDLEKSALYVFFIPIIGFIGRIIYPVCYEFLGKNEHKVSAVGFLICIPAALLLFSDKLTPVASAVMLSILYASVSIINTSFLSIYPIQFAKSGNIASVSGIMDFATYLGAGISSAIYGTIIDKVGFSPIFMSWAVASILGMFFVMKLYWLEKRIKI